MTSLSECVFFSDCKLLYDTLRMIQYLSSHQVFWCGSCCSSYQYFVLSYHVSLRSESCCDVRYDFRIERMFGSSLPPVVCRRAHVLFTLFMLVFVQWCPTHIVLCFCFVDLLVYSMLPVSLDCPCFIAPSVFSNIYLVCQLIRIIPLSHSTPDPNSQKALVLF